MRGYAKYRSPGLAFVEQIPAHWEVVPFRHVFTESREVNGENPVGPMLSVSGYRGVEIKEYDSDNRRRTPEEVATYRVVRQGQLAVNTMWLNYAGLGVSAIEGHMSPAYRAYDISRALEPRYVHHLLRSSIYVQGYTALLTGIRPNSLQMSRDDLMSFPVIVPPLEDQRLIADYLDRETAEIDSLVKLWGELLTIVRERKKSFLDRIITSSTEQFTRVKHLLLRPISDGPHETPTFLDNGIPFLSVDGIQDGELIFEGCRYISEEDHLRYAKKIYPQKGDVLMGKAASTGKIALVRTEQEFNVWSPLAILRPNPSLVNGAWLTWALKATAAQVQIDLACTFNTQKNIAMSDIGNLEVPVPPLEEQLRLVNALDSFSRRSGEIEKEVNAAIGLAIERRAALISAAVTGQVDVTAQSVSAAEQLRDELEVHV